MDKQFVKAKKQIDEINIEADPSAGTSVPDHKSAPEGENGQSAFQYRFDTNNRAKSAKVKKASDVILEATKVDIDQTETKPNSGVNCDK